MNLTERLLDSAITYYVPNKLIYDKAAEGDKLRGRLDERNVELTCPHRNNRVRPSKQGGRALRRYRRRWIIARTISWLHDVRRLVTRYELYSFLFHSFAKIASVMILLTRSWPESDKSAGNRSRYRLLPSIGDQGSISYSRPVVFWAVLYHTSIISRFEHRV
ncbi:MAG: transposase [Planctomycetales bacterium]|nr:transposase [Planctomycetales bacterium]